MDFITGNTSVVAVVVAVVIVLALLSFVASRVRRVPPNEALIVVGGASHSDLWMQIIADVTGRPVLTIEEDVEAAMGAAILAAYAVGLVTADEVRQGWVTLVPRAKPQPAPALVYDRMFELYKGLYPSLKGTLHGLHELRSDS